MGGEKRLAKVSPKKKQIKRVVQKTERKNWGKKDEATPDNLASW